MTSCSCAVYLDVDCDSTLAVETIRKARKSYRCYECKGVISVGERYEETTQKYDGDFSRYRTCLDCVSVRDSLFCGSWYWGQLWEHLGDHFSENGGDVPSSECMMALTQKAREKVCALIEKIWSRTDDDD